MSQQASSAGGTVQSWFSNLPNVLPGGNGQAPLEPQTAPPIGLYVALAVAGVAGLGAVGYGIYRYQQGKSKKKEGGK